jgi:D-serine deaminase-like pyridoxal phosphate-dependent protein
MAEYIPLASWGTPVSLEAARRLLATTTDQVRDRYGPEIGRPVQDLVTPALVLDIEVAQRNIARMAAEMAVLPASLRPHIKVHKSPQLAQRQVDVGAIGLSCATVWEAVILAAAGLDDLFLVNTLTTPAKLDVVATLGRERRMLVAVDDIEAARLLDAAAARAGSTLGVVIEVDTGMVRAGVVSLDAAMALARGLVPLRHLTLEGVTGYEGHCSLTPDPQERSRKQAKAMGYLVEVAEAIRAGGMPLPIVSAAGTATWEWTSSFPGVTESQAGSYVLMDNFHRHMAPEFDQALTVAATIISRPPGRLIVDVGSKSIGDPMGSTMRGSDRRIIRFDEEHGILASDEHDPALGDVVQLVPGYAPSTVNWFDAYHVVRDGIVIDIWPVIPRGPGHHGLAGGA